MAAKCRIAIPLRAAGVLIWLFAAWRLPAQQAVAQGGTETAQVHEDPLAELSPENRALFGALREAAEKGHDADVVENGKKLLQALNPDTPLANFVTQIAATSALETGDTSYALALIKPFADAHPKEWRAATLLARLYAESDQKTLRDQQIARVIALHKQAPDADFGKLHIFPIQKVRLHSGYAMFFYPFEPLRPENSYLVALIYTSEGKQDYRIELESADVDQAFFKAKKPGERRFSIDSFRKNETNANWPESQSLNGFVDGNFDYDTMRDQMLNVANGGKLPRK